MSDEQEIVRKLNRVEKLLEDSIILSAVQAGANKRAPARALSIQNARISPIAKVFPQKNENKRR